MDTKPELEIYADDVKCTHGATVGQLDPDALFYLRSRGVEKTAAENLLTYAFASDVVERIGIEPIRREVESMLYEKLPQAKEIREPS
jgi:Fe-S cluster assembly protein SufD